MIENSQLSFGLSTPRQELLRAEYRDVCKRLSDVETRLEMIADRSVPAPLTIIHNQLYETKKYLTGVKLSLEISAEAKSISL